MGMGMDEDLEYDAYEEGLMDGDWTTSNGGTINVSDMSLRHLRGARRRAELAALNATFSYNSDTFNIWVDIFDDEIARRERQPKQAPVKKSTPAIKPRGAMIDMRCWCGREYTARLADVKRGWARSCSKSCAAIRRDFGRPSAKPADGSKLPKVTKKKRR